MADRKSRLKVMADYIRDTYPEDENLQETAYLFERMERELQRRFRLFSRSNVVGKLPGAHRKDLERWVEDASYLLGKD